MQINCCFSEHSTGECLNNSVSLSKNLLCKIHSYSVPYFHRLLILSLKKSEVVECEFYIKILQHLDLYQMLCKDYDEK